MLPARRQQPGRPTGDQRALAAARLAHDEALHIREAARRKRVDVNAATNAWHFLYPGERWVGFGQHSKRRRRRRS